QVNQAETNLEQFRKRENLVSPELQSKAIVEGLASVQDERQKNRAQLRDTQARYTALQRQLARSPNSALLSARLSQSPRYQSLLSEIQKTELAIEQRRVRYTDDSFLTKPLLEQRQRQQSLLQQEVGRVLGRTPAQLNGSRLLQAGQLGTTDQALANQLVEAQVSLRALQAREQSLAQTERSFTAQLRRFPSLLAQFGRLQPDAEINRETLEQLLKARQELALEIARGGFDWQVVEEPKLGTQIGPSLKRNLLLGAVAGLMLGTVAAFVRDAIDDAVHTSDDLKKQVALPLLGMVPELSQAELSSPLLLFRKPTLAATTERVVQWQSFREAMDLIYQSLQLLHPDFPPRSLVITSALAGEGKSTLALGLAMSAARLHQRVLLIDADLRRPSLHKQLNLPNDRGLSTLLTSDADPNEMQPTASYHNISVLTSGPPPADPAKLLSSRRMGELLAAFEQNYDLVLLDAPPVLGIVDTIVTASFCSGVVLVGRIDHVTRSQLTQATTMLNKLNVIGVIANGASRANNSYVAYEKRSNALFQSS
ncbi:polysaccharide biosynthesis tyrosine autokinase, partial [Leptolyngbya sp. FACHB-36]|uniref:exopolysaccharide transport family protein n=1 Tax=Leptolyngbya sp. FACHB-36 TaxID=2692808 RepID=UPI0016804E1F